MLCRSHGAVSSFRAAVARALAPPRGALHPVTWIHTRHVRTPDLASAVEEMARDAAQGPARKAAAGIRGGRPLQNPALHYTLFWYTTTAREEIRRAVAESLMVLGLDEHQAVLVGRDGPVPHVHVVVNRVSGRDGRAASTAWTGLTLARWRRRWEHSRNIRNLDASTLPRNRDDPPPPYAA